MCKCDLPYLDRPSARLQVRVSPENTVVREGTDVIVQCIVTPRSSDVTITWRSRAELSSSLIAGHTSFGAERFGSELRLPAIRSSEGGQWYCEATRRSDGDYARASTNIRVLSGLYITPITPATQLTVTITISDNQLQTTTSYTV